MRTRPRSFDRGRNFLNTLNIFEEIVRIRSNSFAPFLSAPKSFEFSPRFPQFFRILLENSPKSSPPRTLQETDRACLLCAGGDGCRDGQRSADKERNHRRIKAPGPHATNRAVLGPRRARTARSARAVRVLAVLCAADRDRTPLPRRRWKDKGSACCCDRWLG
jgi:hypothetical protein